MNFLRENWDTAFLVIVLAFILSWFLTITMILPLMP